MLNKILAGLWMGMLAGVTFAVETTRPAVGQMGVYRWALGTEAVDAFGEWAGAPVTLGEDFTDNSSWDNVENPGWLFKPWAAWVKAKEGRRLIMGVPILPGPWDGSGPQKGTIDVGQAVSLEKGAHGDYNRHYEALAKNLVAVGLGNSILRLGWEFNGGWYAWRGNGKAEALAEYWRQIVKTMRAVKGAEGLQFDWNPAMGYQQFPAEKAWPGDEFVDFVGVDLYDDSWTKDTYPWPEGTNAAEVEARRKKVWNEVLLNGDHGLMFWKKFSAEHHKPLTIPEWGVSDRQDHHGGLDNAYFVEQMHAFIADPKNNVAFHCYFDVEAPDGHHQLSPGKKAEHKTEFPEAAAAFRRVFGKVQ